MYLIIMGIGIWVVTVGWDDMNGELAAEAPNTSIKPNAMNGELAAVAPNTSIKPNAMNGELAALPGGLAPRAILTLSWTILALQAYSEPPCP